MQLNKIIEKKLVSTPVFDVVEKHFEDLPFVPVGLNCNDWVTVIAVDSLEPNPICVFIKQTRWGCEHSTIEFMCGTVDGKENPKETAVREFEEETGIKISMSSLKELGEFNPNPAYFNNKMHTYLYLDKGLVSKYCFRAKQKLDQNEDCEVFIDRLSNQETLLRKGGMSLNSLLLLKEYLNNKEEIRV